MCCDNYSDVGIIEHQMVLSGLGFNCLGTGANYYHLSPPTTAASVYASVRGANMRPSSMGRQLLARTTTQTHKVICLPALEVTRTAGSLAEHGEIEAVGSSVSLFRLKPTIWLRWFGIVTS